MINVAVVTDFPNNTVQLLTVVTREGIMLLSLLP